MLHKKKGDQTIVKLENIKRGVEEFIDPNQRTIRLQTERKVNFLEREQNRINKEVEKFNTQFGGKDLSASQFKIAQSKSQSLQIAQNNLEVASSRIQEGLRKSTKEKDVFFPGEIVKGIATSPFSLAQFGVGAVTRPIKTTEETITGFKELPGAIKEKPFTVGGKLAGELIGFSVLSQLGLGFLKNVSKTSNLKASGKSFIVDTPTKPSKISKPSKKVKIPKKPTVSDRVLIRSIKKIREEARFKKFAIGLKDGEIFGFLKAQFPKAKTISDAKVLASLKKLGRSKMRSKRGLPAAIFEKDIKLTINENAIKNYLRNQFNKRGANFDQLSKLDQNFFVGQIKAKIRTSPELFASDLVKTTLKNVKGKSVREAIRDRLEGKFDEPIQFTRGGVNKGKLTSLQKATLNRVAGVLEKESQTRVKGAIKRGPKELKASEILVSKLDKEFIRNQIKARLRANPAKYISDTAKKGSLEKQQRLGRIRNAIDSALSRELLKLKPTDLLSKSDKQFLLKQIQARIKADPTLTLTKAQRQAILNAKNKAELMRVKSAIERGRESTVKPIELLGKQQKEFVKKQLKAKERTQPERFLGARGQTLIQIQKTKEVAKAKPVFRPVGRQLTDTQRILLDRLKNKRATINKGKQQLRQAQITREVLKRIIKQLPRGAVVGEPLLERLGTTQDVVKASQRTIVTTEFEFQRLRNLAGKEGKRLKIGQSSSEARVENITKQLAKQQNKLRTIPLSALALRSQAMNQIAQTRQQLRQLQQQAQASAFAFESFASLQSEIQGISQLQKLRERTLQRERLKEITKTKTRLGFPPIPPPFEKPTKQRRKLVGPPPKPSWFAEFKPIKQKKFVRINKKPATRDRAKDALFYTLDRSLSTTGRLKKSSKQPKPLNLKIPRGYSQRTANKFREYKIKKGKPIFTKDKWIEKLGRPRLDTLEERRKITGLKLLADRRRKFLRPPRLRSSSLIKFKQYKRR